VGTNVLLLVHRTFSSSETLLKVLMTRFRDAHKNESEIRESNNIKRHIMYFCSIWVDKYFEDFESQSNFADLFKQFLEQAIKDDQSAKTASGIHERLIWKWKEEEEDIPRLTLSTTMMKSVKILSMTCDYKKESTVTGFTVKEVAEVITQLDYEKFKEIKHRELLNQGWKKKDREQKSPNLLKMIAQYNRRCKWAQIAILSARGLEQRQKTLTWFIKLVAYLIKIQNYNSSWAVTGALNSTPIYNMKHTWAGIKKKDKDDFENQTKLFKATGNYRLLRQRMETLKPPAIPQLGVLLKDLVFIDDGFLLMGNKTGLKINFRKCKKLAERIMEGFGKFQQQPFEFERHEMVLAWLKKNQEKVTTVQDTYLLDVSDHLRACDAKEKSKRFWG